MVHLGRSGTPRPSAYRMVGPSGYPIVAAMEVRCMRGQRNPQLCQGSAGESGDHQGQGSPEGVALSLLRLLG
jgi:hypothetical protein